MMPGAAMQLHSVWFGGEQYRRMARVLEHSAREHCPGWDVNIRHVGVRRYKKSPIARPTHVVNTQKMHEWNEIVQGADDGARLLLIDADTVILRPVDDVWQTPFDLAYTTRPRAQFGFNTGVLFLRASETLRRFFRAWWELNLYLLTAPREHRHWRKQYGGISQASLGAILARGDAEDLNLVELPCQEWNCEDSSWPLFNEHTRIVHVKSALRRAVFGAGAPEQPGVERLAGLWTEAEQKYIGPRAPGPSQETMDIVIPVRIGDANEQLRYALRSLEANLPHRRVVIAGNKPSWVQNVLHVPTRQGRSKYRNSTANLEAACQHPQVSDDFIFANDDFFVMHPLEQVLALHRGPAVAVEQYYESRSYGSRYLRGLRATCDLLVQLGYPDPVSYELHVPMPMNKRQFLEVLEVGRHIPVLHKRTLYGNLAELGGERLRDPKLIAKDARARDDWTFVSTMPASWNGAAGAQIRQRFPSRSSYERRNVVMRSSRRGFPYRQPVRRPRVGW